MFVFLGELRNQGHSIVTQPTLKKNVSEKSFQNACNIPQIVFKRHFHKLPLYLKRGKAIEVQELLLYSVIVNGDFSSRWGDICKEDSETGGILFKFYNAL